MLGELLGEWMRLTQFGSIPQYREKAIWLAGTADRRLSEGEPGRWLRDLSDRGYVEVDWVNNRWCCSPVAVTRLPASDGLAAVLGFTRPSACQELSDMNVDVHSVRCDAAKSNSLARPAATLLQYGSIVDLQEAATAIGATYVPCSARQLAAKLQTVALGRESAPPNKQNDTLAYFDANRLTWAAPLSGAPVDGLYRYEGNGRRHFLWYEGHTWRHCDMSAGIWIALARSDTNAIRWRPFPGHDPDNGLGTLFTDLGAPLPPLHRRCLVLCSGLPPQINESARTQRYENVPRGIADVIWKTLGQRTYLLE